MKNLFLKIREWQIKQLIEDLRYRVTLSRSGATDNYHFAIQQLQELKNECLAEQILSSLGEAESRLLIQAVKRKAEEMKKPKRRGFAQKYWFR